MGKSTTHADLIRTAERRAFVLDLRKRGATYQVIAEAAIDKFGADVLPLGWDTRYAYKDVQRELEKLRVGIRSDLESSLRLELARLDDLQEKLAEILFPDNKDRQRPLDDQLKVVDRMLRVMERRSKLEGLDAPEKREVHGGVILQLVGIDPDGDDDSD